MWKGTVWAALSCRACTKIRGAVILASKDMAYIEERGVVCCEGERPPGWRSGGGGSGTGTGVDTGYTCFGKPLLSYYSSPGCDSGRPKQGQNNQSSFSSWDHRWCTAVPYRVQAGVALGRFWLRYRGAHHDSTLEQAALTEQCTGVLRKPSIYTLHLQSCMKLYTMEIHLEIYR